MSYSNPIELNSILTRTLLSQYRINPILDNETCQILADSTLLSEGTIRRVFETLSTSQFNFHQSNPYISQREAHAEGLALSIDGIEVVRHQDIGDILGFVSDVKLALEELLASRKSMEQQNPWVQRSMDYIEWYYYLKDIRLVNPEDSEAEEEEEIDVVN